MPLSLSTAIATDKVISLRWLLLTLHCIAGIYWVRIVGNFCETIEEIELLIYTGGFVEPGSKLLQYINLLGVSKSAKPM